MFSLSWAVQEGKKSSFPDSSCVAEAFHFTFNQEMFHLNRHKHLFTSQPLCRMQTQLAKLSISSVYNNVGQVCQK